MKKSVIIFLLTIFPILLANDNNQKSTNRETWLNFNKLNITLHPSSAPVQIPDELIPPSAVLNYITKLNNDKGIYFDISEVALIYTISSEIDIIQFYQKAFTTINWKVLQKEKHFILAEGYGKSVISVAFDTIESSNKVKILYKKKSLFN